MSAILLTNENRGFGGAEVHTLELARGLVERGLQVHLAVRRDSWLSAQGRQAGLCVHLVGMRNEVDPLSVACLRGLARRLGVGLVHSQATRDLVLGALARKLLPGVALVKSEHTFLGGHRSAALDWAYRRADRVVCVSQALKRQLEGELRLSDERLAVVYNGLDTDRAAPGYSRHPDLARGRWIGVVGSLIEGKGHDDFLRAAARLASERPELGFVVAGEGPERCRLEAEAADAVHFLGFVEDPLAVLAGLEVVVVPSHKETFSLVCLEAMALGRPLVASATGGIPEVVTDRVAGTLYPRGDVDALLAAVVRYLDDPELARRHGEAARRRAVELFSRQAMLDGTEGVYRECGWTAS